MIIRSYLLYLITGLSSLGSKTSEILHFGGVLFGTNESHVQLWVACDKTGSSNGIFEGMPKFEKKKQFALIAITSTFLNYLLIVFPIMYQLNINYH